LKIGILYTRKLKYIHTRKPLCVGKKTTFYKELYKNNHREFCRRFIDTIFIQHFNLFVDKCAKYRVTSAILDYKVIETDVFLWYIRDTLDSFFEFKTTGEAVCSEFITQAIDNLFDEIVNEFRIVAEFPRQKN
jgi:hypothetical protein